MAPIALRWADYKPPASLSDASWMQCFNETANANYTRLVYGTNETPADFDWRRLDIVYAPLLKKVNMTCLLSTEGVYRRDVQGATFVDYPERTKIPNGAAINRGGLRLNFSQPAPVRTWPWVEVMHSPSYGVSSMGHGNLWMYLARGSGLWFRPGRVLVLSDVWDLAEFLNLTTIYNPRLPSTKAVLMDRATGLLRGFVDSIAFTSHIDGGCCHRMVMSELVSLHNFSHHCPVSPLMRRGWPPELRECRCEAPSKHAHVLHAGVCTL